MSIAEQKLFILIYLINIKLSTIPSGSRFRLTLQDGVFGIFEEEELTNLLEKLEKDEKVLRLLYAPYSKERIEYMEEENYYYELSVIQPAYDEYVKQLLERKKQSDSDIIYNIEYTWANEIILNKLVLLATLNSESNNNLVFAFLYKNPKKTFTKEQLEKELNINSLDLHKFVENLHFTREIKKVFFGKVSKNSIRFNNPITRAELESLGITRLLISANIKESTT